MAYLGESELKLDLTAKDDKGKLRKLDENLSSKEPGCGRRFKRAKKIGGNFQIILI